MLSHIWEIDDNDASGASVEDAWKRWSAAWRAAGIEPEVCS